jgi:hypothetical protein
LAIEQADEVGEGHKHQLVTWLTFAAAFGNNHSDGRVIVEPFKLGFGQPFAYTDLAAEIFAFDDESASHVAQASLCRGDVVGY